MAAVFSSWLLHPWIVRWVGVHGRAARDRWLPGAVRSATARCRRSGTARTRRRARTATRRRGRARCRPRLPTREPTPWGWPPIGWLPLRAVLRDRLTEQSLLVLRGTPAAIDVELDPVVCGVGCSLAQGTEQISVELGYTRDSSAKTVVPSGTAPSASPSPPRCSLRRTWVGDAGGEGEDAVGTRTPAVGNRGPRRRREDDEQAGDTDRANPSPTGRWSCSLAVGHACSQGNVVLPARMRFSIRRR